MSRNIHPSYRLGPHRCFAQPLFLFCSCWAALSLLLFSPLQAAQSVGSFQTQTSVWDINDAGSWSRIQGVTGDQTRSLLAPGQPAPVLALRWKGEVHTPAGASWNPERSLLTLTFPKAGGSATLKVISKPTHITLEVIRVEPTQGLEACIWGPYPIAIGETIGELIGVVRDRQWAVGIQGLNAKTLGGYPENEADSDTGYGGDDTGFYPDLPDELRKEQGFRGDTARPKPFGSIIQAYCRHRTEPRIIENWGHPRFLVKPLHDGGVIGSKIALFAVPEPAALDTLGAIEVAEGLPHPMIDGVWAKKSPLATSSYLIVDFSETTIDRAIEMTRRAGLRYLYHSSPFSTWGRFQLKTNLFPHGWAGLRHCIDKARAAGVRVGFHTLSNFITPNDAYVTPAPHPGLAVIGHSEITADLDLTTTEIPIANPDLFNKPSALNGVRIGDELIRFKSVSAQAPWKLEGCQRGAWGTTIRSHAAGASVARLMDHGYNVFLGDMDLNLEIARTIAHLFNETGALQFSFDGLEGNWSSGHGKYACALFTETWFHGLKPELRGQVINDASLPGHYSWHINTRMNWGEPWYAGFRESQTLYRFKNQLHFERNYVPHMLGWFALRPDTSVEDAEWLLARAAGFDAGFALATSLASTAQLDADPHSAETAKQFGATLAILDLIKQWETARMSGAFSREQKAGLRDNKREFHLASSGQGSDGKSQWKFQECFITRSEFSSSNAQPVQVVVKNESETQSLQWVIRCVGKQPLRGLTVQVGGKNVIVAPELVIPAGGNLTFRGGSQAVINDSSWKELSRVAVDTAAARLTPGSALVTWSSPSIPNGTVAKAEFRTLGSPQIIRATR